LEGKGATAKRKILTRKKEGGGLNERRVVTRSEENKTSRRRKTSTDLVKLRGALLGVTTYVQRENG